LWQFREGSGYLPNFYVMLPRLPPGHTCGVNCQRITRATQLTPNLSCSVRQGGRHQQNDLAQPLVCRGYHGFKVRPPGGILSELPWLIVAYEFVNSGDCAPYGLQRPREIQAFKFLVKASLRVLYCNPYLASLFFETPAGDGGWDAVKIIAHHR